MNFFGKNRYRSIWPKIQRFAVVVLCRLSRVACRLPPAAMPPAACRDAACRLPPPAACRLAACRLPPAACRDAACRLPHAACLPRCLLAGACPAPRCAPLLPTLPAAAPSAPSLPVVALPAAGALLPVPVVAVLTLLLAKSRSCRAPWPMPRLLLVHGDWAWEPFC